MLAFLHSIHGYDLDLVIKCTECREIAKRATNFGNLVKGTCRKFYSRNERKRKVFPKKSVNRSISEIESATPYKQEFQLFLVIQCEVGIHGHADLTSE